MCGEQRGGGDSAGAPVGSPPRVRGTARTSRSPCRSCRITPACAGNSRKCWRFGRRWGDHPRVCGEQGTRIPVTLIVQGSPPRVRGTEMHDMYQRFHIGITPACAGNSHHVKHLKDRPEDHPRVCGEQITPSPKIPCLTGSPPRVRGTAGYFLPAWQHPGITPACAGNRILRAEGNAVTQDHPRVCGEQAVPCL